MGRQRVEGMEIKNHWGGKRAGEDVMEDGRENDNRRVMSEGGSAGRRKVGVLGDEGEEEGKKTDLDKGSE